MNAYRESFSVPKEQFPSWRYMTAFAQNNTPPQETARSYFFFWARNAIYYSLRALGISPGAHVLVPAYICKAAVEPFEVFGAEVEFYGVGRNCESDFSEIESKITSRTEAVLAVHYFGFPQRIVEFREICDRHGLALIEDCAHVLGGAGNGYLLGTFGDASVFSWRKFLPIYDGGELRMKRPSNGLHVAWRKETLPFTLKVTKSLLDRLFEQSTSPVTASVSAGVESLKSIWRLLSGAPENKPLFELDSNSAAFDQSLLDQRMSRVSQWILRHSDVTAIRSKRRQNFLFLREHLKSLRGLTLLYSDMPSNVCPWVFPLFFEQIANAHLLLRREGIPAVTWGGVRPQGINPATFPDADYLYDNLVFLPVHQDLDTRELELIVETVRKLCPAAVSRASQGAELFA
jgi:perosamine synthetase